MKEIQPDVFWLDGKSVNLYLCRDADGLTLIDTGMPKSEGLVLAALADLGRPPTDLRRILITHADLDHAGSAAAIQVATGAQVYASEATAVYLQTGRSPKHLPLVAHWLSSLFKYRPVPPETLSLCQDGDVLPVLGGLKVLATPGHTPDHHSFYSPGAGILFAGDALNTRNGRLQSSPKRITADQEAARQSAIRLLAKAPATIACGHGAPLTNHSSDDVMLLFNELRES